MAMSDHILFVKEAKTCSYVLVVNTPRLCGEPGFKSHHDVVEQAQIRCREIVHTQSQEFHDIPETDYPQKIPRVRKIQPPKVAGKSDSDEKGASHDSALLKAIEAILGGSGGQVIVQQGTVDGEMVIEFLDEFPEEEYEAMMDAGLDKITDALRAAGFDIKGNKKSTTDKLDEEEESSDPRSPKQDGEYHRVLDEL